jgi:NAD(P)-dependent dehydrogenase (short-subunit alcohol dehydrogenase family)
MIMNLHTKAPFQLVRAAAPHFMAKDGEPRSIINASWLQGNVYNSSHPPLPSSFHSNQHGKQ